MEVFVSDKGYNDKFPLTSAGKYRYKETEEGQEIMCEIVEKIREEGHAEGRAEGMNEILSLYNWLKSMGRANEAELIMQSENADLREKLWLEYKSQIVTP